MKLRCTIGTQKLRDGRRYGRGDEYEVDDKTAKILISQGYAKELPTPKTVVVSTQDIAKKDDKVVPSSEHNTEHIKKRYGGKHKEVR